MGIHLLSADTVGKIAAGEVVERPASVVKELLENSLDAGARTIHLEIAGGGTDLIRIADDGCGIPRDELPLALERHATSKISSAEELSSISTLGFRGEALASIAAVSELTVLSRTAGEASAFQLRSNGGVTGPATVSARAVGTTISVERLFYNVPARRKFLRTNAAEAAQVAQLVSQYAIAYPEVAFQLQIEGRKSLTTPGSGNPLDAAMQVLGKDVAGFLLPVEASTEVDHAQGRTAIRVSGYVADPGVSRASRSSIWLFVNRRFIKSHSLSFAVEESYQTLLQVGRHPIAFVNLQVPPTEVDVNVHPTKTEVRLLRERAIYATLRDAVRETLAGGSSWAQQVSGLEAPQEKIAPWETIPPTSPPTPGQSPVSMPRLIDTAITANAAAPAAPVGGHRLPILRLMGQVAQSYIVAEGEQGLYLIDQHAAHERVLLERLHQSMDREGNTQLLLEPIVLEVTALQREIAEAAGSALESLGFRLEPFGEQSILVRGIPSELPSSRAVQALEQSLQELTDNAGEADWRERMAVALSCRSAVKAGQPLSAEEMRALVEALEEAGINQHCSHGRPTAILLSRSQLEREFGRR
ncbi:MAG TPA: DNA mismatch repair endonuclease MutL [Chloroflexota bacterium]|nr:DNA mismatch repair endonuclease MutL [Chloroflexota bacterium]